MKKKIVIVTATRAEYGLLKPLIKKLQNEAKIDLRLVVTGAHLSPEFGMTYREIEQDGFKIDHKIDILLSADSESAITKTMGLAMISFADYFKDDQPDLVMVLGDRYETLAVAISAMNQRIPIAHLYGGETTEGAIDEAIRHAITKLSLLHFTSADAYRQRVIQLGEDPSRVFNVGSVGVENALHTSLLTEDDLRIALDLHSELPFAVVTYHPVTLDNDSAENDIKQLLDACTMFTDIHFIITKSNADAKGRTINHVIDQYSSIYQNFNAYSSLGTTKYLSALKHAQFVIGNSSSGLYEAPSFGIPTINIGDRQKGRLQANSVINCLASKEDIVRSIKQAMSSSVKEAAASTINPFGDGNTSSKIVNILREQLADNQLNLKKVFYNVEVNS